MTIEQHIIILRKLPKGIENGNHCGYTVNRIFMLFLIF
jgi:hypothetical protein